jgi:hypothetical protein
VFVRCGDRGKVRRDSEYGGRLGGEGKASRILLGQEDAINIDLLSTRGKRKRRNGTECNRKEDRGEEYGGRLMEENGRSSNQSGDEC